MNSRELSAMRYSAADYRAAREELSAAAKPTQAQRDKTQAYGMSFHHHIRLHADEILDRMERLFPENE